MLSSPSYGLNVKLSCIFKDIRVQQCARSAPIAAAGAGFWVSTSAQRSASLSRHFLVAAGRLGLISGPLLSAADQSSAAMRALQCLGSLLGPITLLCLSSTAAAALPPRFSADPLAGEDWNASVTVDLESKKLISPVLYGIFFEEVGWGGGRHDAAAVFAGVLLA